MRRLFTVVFLMFVLVVPIAAQEIKFIPIGPYPRDNVYGSATAQSQGPAVAVVLPDDGKPVIYGWKFRSILLNWSGGNSYDDYRRVPYYPASSDNSIQLTQQQSNPTSIWQGLVDGFHDVAHVRALDTTAFDQIRSSYDYFRSGDPVIVTLPIPNSKDPQMYFADISMQTTYTRDSIQLDSIKQKLLAVGLYTASVLVWDKSARGGYALMRAGDVFASYGRYAAVASQRFAVTVHLVSSATGDFIPFERETPELVPIYAQNEVYFLNTARGTIERWSMKNPITAVMQSIARDFIQQFPAKIGLSESEIAGRQVDREVADKRAELARLRATNQRLRELKPICEQIRAEAGELDEVCVKALALP